MGGISGWEGAVLLLIVLLVVGPEKLPEVAGQLGRAARMARDLLRQAKTSLKDELGDDLSDLKALDPRQYDPRRIVREALMEDPPNLPTPRRPAREVPPAGPAAEATPGVSTPDAGGAVPFDDEAT